MGRIDGLGNGDAGVVQPEPGEHGRIGSRLGRRPDNAGRAVRCGFEMADEIVMSERQQRCREHVERENELQTKADGSATEPAGCTHLQIDYTGGPRRNKMLGS